MKKIIKRINNTYMKIKSYSYLANIIVFISKILLYSITKSFALIISSLYNLEIVLARKNIYSNKENYYSIGGFLILASLWFIFYSVWIIIFDKLTNYNLYSGIAIATVTFYDIGYSIYGIRKSGFMSTF